MRQIITFVRSFRTVRNVSINSFRSISTSLCRHGVPQKYDYLEDVVCEEKDIDENEMKLLPLGKEGGKILLIKQKGELHAIGTKCTHYGAMLHTGALGDGRVRCPWHGACFSIKTGDIEDYPGLNSLPCYKVSVDEEGLVHVKAKRKDLDLNKRVKEMCKYDPNNPSTIVIVGGGPAGATCAESLRQEGFSGKIVMVCKEDVVPYDRIKVSKDLDFDVEKSALRPPSFYYENNIDVKLGIEATRLNAKENILELSNNEKLSYNYLFICTGSKARMPNMPGANLSNIFVMRNYKDSKNILSLLSPDKHLIVLGLSFIAMEAAAYCVDKVASITVIGLQTVPFKPVFGADVGERLQKEFEQKGVKFIFENSIAKFIAKEGAPNILGSVELNDGKVLPADIAIIGIGAVLNTDWVKESDVEMLQNGSIKVNEHLQTSVENVYAGGDVAHAPLFGTEDISAAIGHYPLAHYHGKMAALNMCAKTTPLNAVPFFWTTLFGKSYRYAGFGKPKWLKICGSLENLEFFVYYIGKDDKVIAMSSVGADPIVADFANFLHEGKWLTRKEIDEDHLGWIRNKPKDLTRFQNVKNISLTCRN